MPARKNFCVDEEHASFVDPASWNQSKTEGKSKNRWKDVQLADDSWVRVTVFEKSGWYSVAINPHDEPAVFDPYSFQTRQEAIQRAYEILFDVS